MILVWSGVGRNETNTVQGHMSAITQNPLKPASCGFDHWLFDWVWWFPQGKGEVLASFSENVQGEKIV